MAIPGNPKIFAKSIAEGFAPFTRASCRRLSPGELKIVYRSLDLVMRDFRSIAIPLDDMNSLQQRNRVLQRAGNARLLISAYAKKNRIIL